MTDQFDFVLFVALLLGVCSLQDVAELLLPKVTPREDIVNECLKMFLHLPDGRSIEQRVVVLDLQ